MKALNLLTLVIGLTSFSAMAADTSTECTFKKNPKNKVFITFDSFGNNQNAAKVMLFIETQQGLVDFTYYNYSMMVNLRTYGEQTPWGKRAELVNQVNQLEQSGKFSFDVVNYNTTAPALTFAAIPNTKRNLGLIRGKKSIGFDAKLKTILNTNVTRTLENGTKMSENDVSCVLRYL